MRLMTGDNLSTKVFEPRAEDDACIHS
jgi:hypothetical protein